MTRDITLHIDPGPVHTGIVVCRIMTNVDFVGVPFLHPLDGLTISRLDSEDPRDKSRPVGATGNGKRRYERYQLGAFHGQIRYAERVSTEIIRFLDTHEVSDDRIAHVFIEGFTLPPGEMSRQVLIDSIWLGMTLGYVAAEWPDHIPVAPSGKWPGLKTKNGRAKSGWDNDPEPAPDCLIGRRPKGWSVTPGVNRGTHQKSAYNMGRAGWRTVHGVHLDNAEKVRRFRAPGRVPTSVPIAVQIAARLGESPDTTAYAAVARELAPAATTAELVDLTVEAMLINRSDGDATALRRWMATVVAQTEHAVA